MGRSVDVAIVAVTVWLGLGTISLAKAQVTYYACVNNSNGAITMVSAKATCKTGFHKIQWNQEGRKDLKDDSEM